LGRVERAEQIGRRLAGLLHGAENILQSLLCHVSEGR
jgi:hypothetical protein